MTCNLLNDLLTHSFHSFLFFLFFSILSILSILSIFRSKHVSLRFVQPLTQCKEKCLIENTLSQFTVPADLAGVGGWWVPYAMPHEIDPELFLAYWKECHAVLDQSVGTQACAVFSVPFVRPLSVANYDTRLDYMLGARLPTSPFPTSHIVSNSNVTDIGGFAGVFGGKIPASFMYAASLAVRIYIQVGTMCRSTC